MKNFKTSFHIVSVLAIGALALSSCAKQKERDARKALLKMVENVDMSEAGGKGTTLKSITYKDNVLTYVNEVSADTLERIKSKEFQTATLDNLRKNMGNRKLVKKIVEAKANVEYVFYNGTDTLTFTYTPDEIQ